MRDADSGPTSRPRYPQVPVSVGLWLFVGAGTPRRRTPRNSPTTKTNPQTCVRNHPCPAGDRDLPSFDSLLWVSGPYPTVTDPRLFHPWPTCRTRPPTLYLEPRLIPRSGPLVSGLSGSPTPYSTPPPRIPLRYHTSDEPRTSTLTPTGPSTP